MNMPMRGASHLLAVVLRRTVVISFAVVMAACSTASQRGDTRPAGQQTTCSVPGNFCNTFFGP